MDFQSCPRREPIGVSWGLPRKVKYRMLGASLGLPCSFLGASRGLPGGFQGASRGLPGGFQCSGLFVIVLLESLQKATHRMLGASWVLPGCFLGAFWGLFVILLLRSLQEALNLIFFDNFDGPPVTKPESILDLNFGPVWKFLEWAESEVFGLD